MLSVAFSVEITAGVFTDQTILQNGTFATGTFLGRGNGVTILTLRQLVFRHVERNSVQALGAKRASEARRVIRTPDGLKYRVHDGLIALDALIPRLHVVLFADDSVVVLGVVFARNDRVAFRAFEAIRVKGFAAFSGSNRVTVDGQTARFAFIQKALRNVQSEIHH